MLSLEQLRDAAYVALRLLLGESYSANWCIVATFPDSIIVSRGPLKLERYTLTVATDRSVTLSTAQAVELVYQALTESRGSGLLGPMAPFAEAKDGAAKDTNAGKEWACVVIEEGLSSNRRLYTAAALHGAVKLFEGARCYFTHAASTKAEPDPRDLGGFLRSPKVALLEATKKTVILANFRSVHARATELLQEAFEAGNPHLFGLSIHAGGKGQVVRLADGPAYRVDSIDVVESVDIVSKPAAGGRFLRLVAGMPGEPVTDKELEAMKEKLEKLKTLRPEVHAKLREGVTEAEVDLLLEAIATQPAATPPPAPAPTPAPAPVAAPAAAGASVTLTEAEAAQLRRMGHTFMVDQALAGRTMPEPIKAAVRASLLERVGMTEAQVAAEVNRWVETSAKTTAPPPVGSGLGKPAVGAEVTNDEATKYVESIEAFFFHDADEKVRGEYKKEFGKDPPKGGPNSLKELYVTGTGDKKVSGKFVEAQGRARYLRLMEGVAAYFEEAIGTGTLSNAFASSMNRRLLAEYRAAEVYQKWRRLVSRIQPLSDFRNQERVRWGHFGDLPIVAQSGTYTELADPTDEKVTYAPAKRGAIVSVTREAIKNDDVGIVRQIPQRLALSAARTIHKFVTDFIITNPNLDDGVALFAAAATRGASSSGNLQTAALSTTTVGIARQRLLKVQDKDAKTTLGLAPKLLIVPPELEELAIRLTSIPVYPVSGQNATEPNIIAEKYGLNEYMVLETMADANDWFIAADPRIVDLIEMGFVDGQEEPMILVQDQELVGSVFAADKWSFKVRHEYGGDVVEWRGTQAGIVA